MSAPKKKKGMTLDEKRSTILGIVGTSGDVFNLKDLEKIGAKNGVVEKTVKDVVQSLVDDRFIDVDKIGSGNFYWSFPSASFIKYKVELETLESQLAAEEKSCEELDARIRSLSSGREDSETRAEQLRELASLKAEQEKLDVRLKELAASDPDALNAMKAKAEVAKTCADRWTDNVWVLKSHLCSKFGRSAGEVDAMLGIPDGFDYVA